MLRQKEIEQALEAILLAAEEPVSIDRMISLFDPGDLPEGSPRQAVRTALGEIEYALEGHGYELKQVASGYRFQIRQSMSPWVSRLRETRPPRFSRALMETLALIAYKQPATRGDIEAVRGVGVSPNIMRTLLERGWINVVGQRAVPGRPTLYGTTRAFLDYFNLKSLDQLPPLSEIRALVDPHVDEADEPTPDDAESSETEETEIATGEAVRPLAEIVPLPTPKR